MATSILFRQHCVALHSYLQRLADSLEAHDLGVGSILSGVKDSLIGVERYGSNLELSGSDRELNQAATIAYFRHPVPYDGEACDGGVIRGTRFSLSCFLSRRTMKALCDHVTNGGSPADFVRVISGLVPLWNIRECSFGQITDVYRDHRLVPRYEYKGDDESQRLGPF